MYGDARRSWRYDSPRSSVRSPPLLAKLPNLLLFGGGVVIKINDEMIGAIGAAGAPGGDLDENCARAGLEKIRARLQ